MTDDPSVQRRSARVIADLPGSHEEADQAAVGVGDGVQFGVHAARGVFKRISERARLDSSQAGTVSRLDRNARVFKVALGRRQVEEDRIRFGLENGLIHVGWGGDIDWSDERFDDFNPAYSPNSAPLSALGAFGARDVLHPGL